MSSGLVRREGPPLDALTQRLLGETGELRKFFFRDLVLDFPIGVHAREQGRLQRVAVNLELVLAPPAEPHGDDISKVLDYDMVRRRVMALSEGGHVNLVETLAERIADLCLAFPEVLAVRSSVAKLDLYDDGAGVGFEITRVRG